MHKKLLEMLDAIKAAKENVTNLVNENKLEEAKVAKDGLKNLQEQFDLLKDVLDPEGNGMFPEPPMQNIVPVNEKTLPMNLPMRRGRDLRI